MKNILVAVMALVVFPLTFALKANSQAVSTETKLVELPAVNDLFKLSLRPYVSAGYVDMKSMNFGNKCNPDGTYNVNPNGFGMAGSRGYSLKIGAEVLPILDIEAEYLDMGTFKWTNDSLTKKLRRSVHDEMYFAISATMLSTNLKYPLKVKGVSVTPYVTAGTGRARMNIRYKTAVPASELFYDDKYKDNSTCYKLGGGVKAEVLKNLSVYSEFVHFHTKFSNRDSYALKGKVVNNGMAIGLEWKY